MKRGVIILDLQEAEYMAANFPGQKFPLSVSVRTKEFKVQLSEEDVETFLDSLPMPSVDENSVITSLRKKFSAFLTQLRS